jgi:hypothetical protein
LLLLAGPLSAHRCSFALWYCGRNDLATLLGASAAAAVAGCIAAAAADAAAAAAAASMWAYMSCSSCPMVRRTTC